jgi:hypothetical protein
MNGGYRRIASSAMGTSETVRDPAEFGQNQAIIGKFQVSTQPSVAVAHASIIAIWRRTPGPVWFAHVVEHMFVRFG